MGQKVHPHGFRLGYIYTWKSKWYADKNYTEQLHEDLRIRRSIERMLPDAGISRVEIERNANQITVSIHTARPGIVIGRGGQRVDELRGRLEKTSGRRVRVNINEVRLPEIEAPLVARAVAEQIERRVSHRRAIKQAAPRAMRRGAWRPRPAVASERRGGSGGTSSGASSAGERRCYSLSGRSSAKRTVAAGVAWPQPATTSPSAITACRLLGRAGSPPARLRPAVAPLHATSAAVASSGSAFSPTSRSPRSRSRSVREAARAPSKRGWPSFARAA